MVKHFRNNNLKKCSALFDREAMYKIAEYYDWGDDEDSSALARLWYGVAAGFGHREAGQKYKSSYGCDITAEEKKWFRKSFIKSRHGLLEEKI